MKKTIAVAVLLALTSINAADALTFEGSVEKTDVIKKRSFWQRLFSRHEVAEGRIGVRIDTHGDIAFVHPGSPAEKAGLIESDKVLLVDGRKYSIDQISGEPATVVHLDVRRKTGDEFALDIERVDYRQIQQ
jgi:predicted metalloprotease with PDZ domain